MASAVVNRRGSPPATSTSQRLVVLLFFSTDHSCTVNTTLRPSGDSAGAPSRFMAHRSCGVIGRLSAAPTIVASEIKINTAMVQRLFMRTVGCWMDKSVPVASLKILGM